MPFPARFVVGRSSAPMTASASGSRSPLSSPASSCRPSPPPRPSMRRPVEGPRALGQASVELLAALPALALATVLGLQLLLVGYTLTIADGAAEAGAVAGAAGGGGRGAAPAAPPGGGGGPLAMPCGEGRGAAPRCPRRMAGCGSRSARRLRCPPSPKR